MTVDAIVEKLEHAPYLEEKVKRMWIERVRRDGLTPGTVRALMETVVEHAFNAVSTRFDRNDPSFRTAYMQLMGDIDAAQVLFRAQQK